MFFSQFETGFAPERCFEFLRPAAADPRVVVGAAVRIFFCKPRVKSTNAHARRMHAAGDVCRALKFTPAMSGLVFQWLKRGRICGSSGVRWRECYFFTPLCDTPQPVGA